MKRNPLATVGKQVGKAFLGAAVGSVTSRLAANIVGSLLKGSGDYLEAPAPSANSFTNHAPTVPIMHSDTFGSIRVTHREFLGNITSLTTFGANRFTLNPGDASTFPWLSQIAYCFDQWLALGIVFEYIPLAGDAIAADVATLGAVNMATQYNVLEGPFQSSIAMLNHFWASSGKPSLAQRHYIECRPDVTPLKPMYIRHGEYMAGLQDNTNEIYQMQGMFDPRMFDLGRFEIAREGQLASSALIGQLWVSYDILLMKPRRQSALQRFTYDAPPPVEQAADAALVHFNAVPLAVTVPAQSDLYPDELKVDPDPNPVDPLPPS